MKFKIVAEPDMGAFLSNPQLEAFIRSITEATMSRVTEDIMAEFTATLQQAIQRTNETITTRLSNVTESVIEQITSLTNIGGVETNLGVLDFGFGGYGGGENVDILGGGGGYGGDGNINILGGGGGGFGGGGGPAVIIDQPTVIINVIDNCGKHHTKHCPGGNDCPCPPNDTCPVIYRDMEPATVAPPDITKANWIWTKEVIANPTPPGQARPFRKVIKTKCPVNRTTVDITCDNYYTLYVNGKLVGSSSIASKSWYVAQRWTVEFEETTEVVIAVYAVQDQVGMLQVGLLAAGVVWHSQTNPSVPTSFITDDSWKTFSGDDFDRHFYKEKFSDEGWENAHVEGPYMTTPPWAGGVTLPTKTEAQNGPAWTNPYKGQPNTGNPVPDAPDAPPAKLVTSDSESSKAPSDKATDKATDDPTDKATQGSESSKDSKGREKRSSKAPKV
jgi:hypothetical protein